MDLFCKPASTLGIVPSTVRRWTPLLGKTIVHHQKNTTTTRTQESLRVQKEERVSIMFSVLPTSIQQRLPPLPSIRRTVAGPVTPSRSTSAGYVPVPSPPSSVAATPMCEADGAFINMAQPGGGVEAEDDLLELQGLRARRGRETDYPMLNGTDSGVDWRCGRQGMDLVFNAVGENKGRPCPGEAGSFERTAYVDGVAYLLKGLPRDLDDAEVAVLQRAMPLQMSEDLDSTRLLPGATSSTEQGRRRQSGAGARNLVHSAMLFFMVNIFMCIRAVAPYVFCFFRELMRFEREYRVSEMVLGKTVAGVTVSLSAFRKISDGLAGQMVVDAFDYTADGVSGALRDFAREMARQGREGSSSSRSRSRSRYGRGARRERIGEDYCDRWREYRGRGERMARR